MRRWAIAEALGPQQAARHPGHRERRGPRHRRARLRAAVAAAHRRRSRSLAEHTRSRAPHPARRTDRAARAADRCAWPRASCTAAGRVPAGDRRRRSGAGAARRSTHAPARAKRRRSVLRRRPVRAAARRDGARHRRRRRRGRDRRAQAAAATTRGLKPIDGRDARPVPPAARWPQSSSASTPWCSIRRARARRRRRANSPRSAVPLVVAVSCNPATFARDASELWSTAATGSKRSRRSISSATRRTSRSSRGS